MDDQRLIELQNPLVKGELGPSSIWFQSDFPLSTCALWLQCSHGGRIPWLSCCEHGAACLKRDSVVATAGEMKVPGALFAAMLFAVHPVCVNSVGRIAEIKNTLSLPFFLLSLLLYLHWDSLLRSSDEERQVTERRRNRVAVWLACSLVSFVLATAQQNHHGHAAFDIARLRGLATKEKSPVRICCKPLLIFSCRWSLA